MAGIVLLAAPASAEPSAADRATARQLAQEGYQALQKGEFELAADRFRRADQLVHAPTLLVDLARSLAGLGRLVEAHETYQVVIREGVTDNVPWPWKKAYENAIKEDQALEPRLAWVTITVYGHDSPAVEIDGRPVADAAVGVKRAIDPGRRTIAVQAPGHYPAETTVELAEGSSTRIDMTLLEEGDEAPAEPTTVITQTDAGISSDSSSKKTLAYVAFGVGAAGLVAAGVSSALLLDRRSRLNEACDAERRCPSSAEDDLAAYHTYGTVSAVALGVGVAGGVAGLSLLLFGQQDTPREARALRPVVSPGFVGVDGRF